MRVDLDGLVKESKRRALRHWRGRSGQLWVELRRDADSITLVPEYQYVDSMTNRGITQMSLDVFFTLDMEEVGTHG